MTLWPLRAIETLLLVAQKSCMSDIMSLPSWATKFRDRNRLYSSAISRSAAELWLVAFVYVPMNFAYAFQHSAEASDKNIEAINKHYW